MFERLQYISQGDSEEEQLKNITLALDAGCKWIQLRYKKKKKIEILRLAGLVRAKCNSYNAVLIINDFPEIAQLVDADGVHLGLTDLAASEARTMLGLGKIIGGTANTLEDVLQRMDEQCDYIGLGPFKFTPTKENLSPILGLEGYINILQKLDHILHKPPIYAIGGIATNDINGLKSAGLYGVALSGLITQAPHKRELIKQIKEKLDAKIEYSR